MLRIDRMGIADIPNVVAIDHVSQDEPWTEKAFMEELELAHSLTFVARVVEAESYGVTAGYICLWLVAGEAQVLNLAVHPHHRRLGIGRALLTHALGTARQLGARTAYLEVRKGNWAAQWLYQSVGFEITGERPNFYGYGDKKEAAILMAFEMGARRLVRSNPAFHTQKQCIWSDHPKRLEGR